MRVLGFILCLILGVLLVFLGIGLYLWRKIRKIVKGATGSTHQAGPFGQSRQQGSGSQSQTTSGRKSGKSHSKVFADNEGEYVEFEEI